MWCELDDWGSCINDYIWNSSACDCECIKHVKLIDIIKIELDIKNCTCEKRLIGKLVLECEDEILNTFVTLLYDKKVACAKSNCLIHNISLIIICLLLLVVICVSFYFYYAKYWTKQNYLLPFNDASIKLGEIRY